MSPRRIRPEKKLVEKIENPAELAETLRERLERHQNKLIGGALVFFLIVAGGFGYGAYKASQERKAEAEYARIVRNWPGGRAANQEALSSIVGELEKYMDWFGSADASRNAQLDLGKGCYDLGRYEEALKWSRMALERSGNDRGMRLLARYQTALALEALRRYDEAKEMWTTLGAEGDESLRREVEWRLGMLAMVQGDHGRAVEHLEKALKTEGSYPGEPLIQTGLAEAKGKVAGGGGS